MPRNVDNSGVEVDSVRDSEMLAIRFKVSNVVLNSQDDQRRRRADNTKANLQRQVV
jgi:hypothetical protein